MPEIIFMQIDELKSQVTDYAEEKDSVRMSDAEFEQAFDSLFEN